MRNMQTSRKGKRPLVFVDETWINSNLTVGKCWQYDEIFKIMKTETAARRISAPCEGREMVFIPNASLTYKANTTTGDYHGQMNSQIFKKWEKEKLFSEFTEKCCCCD